MVRKVVLFISALLVGAAASAQGITIVPIGTASETASSIDLKFDPDDMGRV